ncbi:MAG: hypothetical protein JNM68_03950, partial [Dinghuibacter sp.]|nr:hypothetical protein [Dinghuibacter sp.]
MNSFTLHGRVVEQNTGLPLSQLLVKAFSNAKFPGKLPAPVQTNYNGEFSFCITVKSLRELFERKPDIFFSLSKPGITKPFYTSETAWNWRTEGRMLIEVPAEKFAPSRNVRLQLVNEAGEPTESFVPGENLYINATGLRPAHNYKILVQEEKETLFKPEVITDRMGNLNMVPFWPQAGLSDVSGDRMFTVKEALQIWQNRKLSLSLSDGRRRFNSVSFNLAGKPVAPLVFHSDGQGRVLNGFVNDKKTPIILAVHFYRANSEARVYIVPARQNWQHGDAFVPVASGPKGRPAVFEVSLRRSEQMQLVALGSSSQLPPGAYDFIVRPLRYGSEDQRRHTIQPGDILVGNRVTGLVLREEFMHGKLVQGGCVNKLDLSGRGINGQPYFQYADTFEKGEDVYFALDPNIVDPANAGKMCAIYVVPNKSEAEWNTPGGNGLNHLPILGGNAAVQKLLVQTGCVNANKRLVWPAAGIPGEYDIVADFGNNTTNAASFLTDNEYNAPLDIIDGYFSTGFRVVDDPATITQFNFFGQFDYTQPTVTVQDEGNFFAVDSEKILMNITAAMLGRVAFPADMAGATTAAQISAAQPDYPMIFIVHGFGHHYDDYDYLLQHFALNGFIAVAFEIPYINGLGRANLLFHHINYIKNEFGAKAQNNIGIMGHSRGGEAVV